MNLTPPQVSFFQGLYQSLTENLTATNRKLPPILENHGKHIGEALARLLAQAPEAPATAMS